VESPAINLDDVHKSYGIVRAVQGLSLSVPARSVYGFLGPNGAGKTTTIRLILGLQSLDRGTVSLFGQPMTAERIALLRRTGSLVDAPSLYSNLTGHENLEVHRRILGLPKQSIYEALEAVDLLSVANRVAKNYSQGMRQRLGLALALLGNPNLLVLDEPTNGLDPAGIHEVRTLVRNLPKTRGVTVFLSSHLLSEVEQVATHVAILSQGKMQFEGTLEDLRRRTQSIVVLEVDQPERAQVLLSQSGRSVRREGQRLLVESSAGSSPAELNAMLVEARVAVSHLALQRATLEDVFLELTHV